MILTDHSCQVSIEERSMMWMKRVNEKRDNIRKEREKDLDSLCTFAPKIVCLYLSRTQSLLMKC